MTSRQILLLLAVLAAVLVGCGRSNRELITSSGETAASAAFREKAQERWAALLNDPRTEVVAAYENGDARQDAFETEAPAVASASAAPSRFSPVAGLRKLIRGSEESYPADPFLTASADSDGETTGTKTRTASLSESLKEGARSSAGAAEPDDAQQNQFDRLIASSNQRLDDLERRMADSALSRRNAAVEETARRIDAVSESTNFENFMEVASDETAATNAQIDAWADTANDFSHMMESVESTAGRGPSFDELLGMQQPSGNNEAAEILLSQAARKTHRASGRNPFQLASETMSLSESEASRAAMENLDDALARSPFEASSGDSTDDSFEAFIAITESAGLDDVDSHTPSATEFTDVSNTFDSLELAERESADADFRLNLDIPSAPDSDTSEVLAETVESGSLLNVPLPTDTSSSQPAHPMDLLLEPVAVGREGNEPATLAFADELSGDFPAPSPFDSGSFDNTFFADGGSQSLQSPNGNHLSVAAVTEPMVNAQNPAVWDIVAEARRVSPRSWFLIIGSLLVVALLLAPRRSRGTDA